MPNWNCLPRAFARVLDISYDEIMERVGHDGSEIIWEGLSDPWGRRAFHIGELINAAWSLGYSVTPFEWTLESAPMDSVEPYVQQNQLAVAAVMKSYDGVAIGYLRNGTRHAVAWIDGSPVEPLKDFTIEVFHAVRR
jgi:hypothetical protein